MATTSSLRSFDSTVMSSSTPVQSPHKIKRGVSARTLVSPQGSRHKLRSSFTKGVLVGCTGLLVYGLILMKFAAPYVSIKWKDASGPSHTKLGGARDSAVGQTPRPFTSDMSYATMAAQADKLSNTFVSKPPSDDPATAATTVEPTTIDAMTKPADSGERSGSDGLNKAQAGNENEINTEKGQCTIAIDMNTRAHTYTHSPTETVTHSFTHPRQHSPKNPSPHYHTQRPSGGINWTGENSSIRSRSSWPSHLRWMQTHNATHQSSRSLHVCTSYVSTIPQCA